MSSTLYLPHHSGTGTYVISLLGYFRQQGCRVFYTSLEATPGGRKPWYVIPREMAAVGKITVRHNLRIGRLLIRRAPARVWFKELLILIYRRLGKPARAVYHALRGRRRQPAESPPEPVSTSLGNIPTAEEIAFVHQQSQRLRPDVIIANRIHLAPVFDAIEQQRRAEPTRPTQTVGRARWPTAPSDSFGIDGIASNSTPLPPRVTPKSNEGRSRPLLTALLTHEVMHQREDNLIQAGLLKSQDRFWTVEKERESFYKADLLLPIQEDDAAETRRMVPGKEVLTVPMAVEVQPTTGPQIAGRCLYVGGNNVCSAQGLAWFLQEVWPVIRIGNPNAHLHVCGIVCKAIEENHPDLWQSTPQHQVVFRGRVPDLSPEYSAAQVVVIPLLSGSGLKIKLIEALAHGRAIVSTTIGVQGVAQQVTGIVMVADEAKDFAEAVANLLCDPHLRTELEQKSRPLIAEKCSSSAVYRPVLTRFQEVAGLHHRSCD